MKFSESMMYPLPEKLSQPIRKAHPDLAEIDDFRGLSEGELRFILTWYDQSNFREFTAMGWEVARRLVADHDSVGLYGKSIPDFGGRGNERITRAVVTFLVMQSSMAWAELVALMNQFYTIIEDCSGSIDIVEVDKAEKAHEIRNKNLISLGSYAKRINELKAILLPDPEKEKVAESHMKNMRRLSPEKRASEDVSEDYD